MAKTVCVVGAGPSGLVAAKSLLHDVPEGTFHVTIFDSKTRIGGLWPFENSDDKGYLHPQMVTNQSKHTVQFSDLAWEDADPEFPSAWQVGRYLNRYYDRYCKAASLQLGKLVVGVEQSQDGTSGWIVQVVSQDGEKTDHKFDYLLVASGYFGNPGISTEAVEKAEVPMIHSSQYRDLPTLFSKNPGAKGGKILVVGGQMSGVEVAGTIATHLSTAVNWPGRTPHSTGIPPIEDADKYSVHHLIQKPAWVFPLYTSPKPALTAPPFVPLDLSSYNLANRPQPLVNSQGHISTGTARTLHGVFQNILGTDQSIFSPEVTISDTEKNDPPYIAVSDHYLEFVRSGLITVSRGRFEYLKGRDARISSSEADRITDVAAVILATGFQALLSIAWMPPAVLKAISASDNPSNAVALAFHGTHHPEFPTLGFVGFYRSPYWGVMEMQARFITALWAAGGPSSPNLSPAMAAALKEDTSIERTTSLRTDPRASQFPMGDYPWLMQDFASALELTRIPHLGKMPALPPADKPMDILTPARYPSKNVTTQGREEVIKSLQQTEATAWAAIANGRFMARAVFRSLAGRWRLERDLISKLPSHPSGHFSGTADFLLREATRDGREAEYDSRQRAGQHQGYEYLYIEDGEFRASNGFSFQASRRYIWRYDDRNEKLSVWFVKVDKPKVADYLFHKVQFEVSQDSDAASGGKGSGIGRERGLCARADHLCEQDFYDVTYAFNFEAVNIKEWTSAYQVKGPKKDYSISNVFKR
ncbi:hypothetical protein V8F20_005427 [Naviculisporaceae sp. PSN 640]